MLACLPLCCSRNGTANTDGRQSSFNRQASSGGLSIVKQQSSVNDLNRSASMMSNSGGAPTGGEKPMRLCAHAPMHLMRPCTHASDVHKSPRTHVPWVSMYPHLKKTAVFHTLV